MSTRKDTSYATDPYRKETVADRRERHYVELQRRTLEILEGSCCQVCGESDPVVLEFDHRDRTTKHFAIANAPRRGVSIPVFLAEIEKCDILCANCHRRKTAKTLGWYRAIYTSESLPLAKLKDLPLIQKRPHKNRAEACKICVTQDTVKGRAFCRTCWNEKQRTDRIERKHANAGIVSPEDKGT
jgi:hypothetical protein